MSIEEAIEHCKEQAKVCSIKKCADDHLQLAKWLEELKELRNLFTLTAEEASLLRYALGDAILYNEKAGSFKGFIEQYDKMFDKITKWLYDNEI